MDGKRICKKCLLREMAQKDAEMIATYRDAIKDADRVPEEEYERRLAICKECELLNMGTCGACGCYVELRALAKGGKCPYKKWKHDWERGIRHMRKFIRKERLKSISLNNIRVDDDFWNKYTKLVTKEIIPYQWRALNDEVEDAEPSHCIDNFKIAAGLKEGTFHGWVFQDTDLAKWLEAVAYSLSYEKNDELEKLADEAIELVGKAQEENGYLNTHFSILYPGKQFKNLKEGHELYGSGHFIEAAVAYYQVTGKDKLLNIMKKNADLICEVFHTGRYANAVPGHEEVELALMKLADVTGDKKYADMAKEFIDRRGTEPNYLFHESEREDFIDVWHDNNPYINEYGQNHKPVREQTTAEGHAVRAVYLYCAMADIAEKYHDETLLQACENLYNNMVQKRMYITGGIGTSGTLERFTTDYDLPNDTNYSESCASIGLALFCRRMAQITGDGKYIDTMELALMNTVLAGIAMDGKSFFYVNPLEVWPKNCIPGTDKNHIKAVRQKWFGCACCPPNIARTLSSLGEYLYFTSSDGLYVNLYAGGTLETSALGGKKTLAVDTKFPFEGKVSIKLESKEKGGGKKKLYLRIPEYAACYKISVDGKEVKYQTEQGYAVMEDEWDNQTVDVAFDMPVHFAYANPEVRADIGKVAVVKGPLVYCLEETDNGENLASMYVDLESGLEEEWRGDILDGVMTVKAKGKQLDISRWDKERLYMTKPAGMKEKELIFVPYANWGNREQGEMAVWVKYC